jgi:hypothetical protein
VIIIQTTDEAVKFALVHVGTVRGLLIRILLSGPGRHAQVGYACPRRGEPFARPQQGARTETADGRVWPSDLDVYA